MANTDPKSNSSEAKVFDIFGPNHKRPQPTSRPIITNNKPQQPDPMVMEGSTLSSHKPLFLNAEEMPETKTATMEDKYSEVIKTTPDEQAKPPIAESVIEMPDSSNKEPVTEKEPVIEKQPEESALVEQLQGSLNVDNNDMSISTPIVSIHKDVKQKPFIKWLLAVILLLIVVIVVIDVLLDSGVWKPSFNIIHTHLINGS